jgi:SAM-dependent methyltransferase
MSFAPALCPVCTFPDATSFFSATDVPVTCASIFSNRADALAVPKGDVHLAVCHRCGFVSNPAFDVTLGEAGARYESSQAASAHFTAFARSLAGDWVNRYGLSGKTVLEVGCGSGAFLTPLLECGVASAIGIDPLALAIESTHSVRAIADTFDERYLTLTADALVCRHTLEHIPDVRGFLRLLQTWARLDPRRVVLFELPDAQRVLVERAFWDIYYEHCNYFTEESLRLAFELAGFEVLRSSRAYDDQYLILEAVARTDDEIGPAWPDTRETRALCEKFARDVNRSIRRCERSLAELASQGAPLVLWQGASKTVGFLAALSSCVSINSAVDLSTQRQGKFLPGSGLPVYGPEELLRLQPRHIVLMNPVYLDEVTTRIRELGVAAQVHTVNELLG